MLKQFCGYISIIGKPNVGKSTILNSILDKKVSITSRKSQTTRNNILGIKTENNKQMIFIDTPGMHIKSKRTMNKILNKSAQGIIEDSDIVLFVIQRLSIDNEDEQILKKLQQTGQKTICVINKIDQVDNKNKFLPFIEKISSIHPFDEIILVSAKTKDGLNDLVSIIKNNLPENNHIYDNNFKIENDQDSFMFGDELPHDTFVEIDLIEDKEDIVEIHATIYVSRKSQKQIVIGSGGEVLKQIGKQSRLEIEKNLNKKVFLKTWVKVKKNWNTDSGFIQSLGVGGNYESK